MASDVGPGKLPAIEVGAWANSEAVLFLDPELGSGDRVEVLRSIAIEQMVHDVPW